MCFLPQPTSLALTYSPGLAGIELMFFLVVGTVVCLRFRMRTLLITHWCFSCCWAVPMLGQGLLSFARPASKQAQIAKKLGGNRDRRTDPDWQKGYLMPYAPCSAYKPGRKLALGPWLGNWLGISPKVVRNCFHLHHFSCVFSFYNYHHHHYYHYILVIKLLSSQQK